MNGTAAKEILLDLGMDEASILTASLYPKYTNNILDAASIGCCYGEEILNLLIAIENTNNFSAMLAAVTEDVRVVVIKLALHLEAMRNAIDENSHMQTQLALTSKDIYIPLAEQLGIGKIKGELEDLSFRFLEPQAYTNIAQLLATEKKEREAYLKEVIVNLTQALDLHNIKAEFTGRVKHVYSIWKKMCKKGVDYSAIYDVRAIRILVNNARDCYTVLSIVHALWPHIPKEFDDYITQPKENGYQSLHTAVVTEDAKVLEIQIRTKSMHCIAELGVAAHWRYKNAHIAELQGAKLANLRQLINWQEKTYTYASCVIIKAYQRSGLLRDITSALGQEMVGIKFIKLLPEQQKNLLDFKLKLEASSRENLIKALARLHQIHNVYDVYKEYN